MFRLTAPRKWIIGSFDGAVHTTAIVMFSSVLYCFIASKFEFSFWTYEFNLLFIAAMTLVGGLVAGTIFGVYFYLTARFLSLNSG